MILFTNKQSCRLDYIAEFAQIFFGGKQITVCRDISAFINYTGPKINYGPDKITDSEIWIQPHSLIFEAEIIEQQLECFDVNGYKAFFKTGGDYPFDIFAASFYLLSRYEEYLPHHKDEYGRYAHINSIAFKEGFINLPLINIWFYHLLEKLRQKFPAFVQHPPPFAFIPTYDIDEAWAYKNKEWWRNTGGTLRDVLKGDVKRVATRMKVLVGKEQDPYDTYDWIDFINEKNNPGPIYFFLAANKRGKFDKNISPLNLQWQQLVKRQSEKYTIGIHPSWQSGDEPALFKNEIELLKNISSKKIVRSRQHYIRFTLPETYRRLVETGISEDYSMGYGSINGFRASVATPFYWYDLEREEQTSLLIHPFCFMDANSYYEQKQTAEQAYEELMYYYNTVKSVDGTLITIWHNNFFGTDKRFRGWKEMYARFLSIVYARATF